MKLTADLMFDIFVRLECRDIVSCMGVCRAWRNFISDPSFSINYSRYSPFSTFLVSQEEDYSYYFFLIHVTVNGEFIRRPIKPKVMRSSKGNSTVSVIGSCNGLVFFSLRKYKHYGTTEKVYFGNPVLGKYVGLRVFKRVNKLVRHGEYKVGFVPSTKKIKLLSIGFDDDRRVQEAHILTFKEDSEWRKLEDSLTSLIPFYTGTCFNGVYHWVVKNVAWICTFDFEGEKCGRMSKPPGLLQSSSEMRMTVLNNHLCLIEHKFGVDMTIWTMKEYGAAESWSKYIRLLSSRFQHISIWSLLPFAVLPNGDILFSSRDATYDLISYSPKTKHCSSVRFLDAHPKINASHASAYAPRFYALEEDFGRNGSRFRVLSGIFRPFSVNKLGDFVHKLCNKLGFGTAAAISI